MYEQHPAGRPHSTAAASASPSSRTSRLPPHLLPHQRPHLPRLQRLPLRDTAAAYSDREEGEQCEQTNIEGEEEEGGVLDH